MHVRMSEQAKRIRRKVMHRITRGLKDQPYNKKEFELYFKARVHEAITDVLMEEMGGE